MATVSIHTLIDYQRIVPCLACVYRVMDACGKFGEHQRSVPVARDAASSNSSFFPVLGSDTLKNLVSYRLDVSKHSLKIGH